MLIDCLAFNQYHGSIVHSPIKDKHWQRQPEWQPKPVKMFSDQVISATEPWT